MSSKLLMESKSFSGTLSFNGKSLELEFSVYIEISGEAVLLLPSIPLNKETKFISDGFYNIGPEFNKFSLNGTSPDGVTLKSNEVIFTSLNNHFSGISSAIRPSADYESATITMPSEAEDTPILCWKIKGFRSFSPLSFETELGTVEMIGGRDANGRNEVSGHIKVISSSPLEGVESWLTKATSLCNHLLHVMSFAENAKLACPIAKFFYRGKVEVELYSCGEQQKSVFPPIHWMSLNDIFRCAIKNYFAPQFEVKNLYFAIQWFNIHSSYREANLISSMTVLENLIDSNLTDQDCLLFTNKQFNNLRRKLSCTAKEQIREWTDDESTQNKLISDVNEKFSDLKRRSLIDKINILATRWGVKFDDIAPEKINGAKSARDQVVHRGYYTSKANMTGDLHDHVLLVREIVVRFILTALNFEGRYKSYVSGQKSLEFRKNIPKLDYTPKFQ